MTHLKKRRLFGTDGVRGLANQAPMDPETALGLGRALARVFLGKSRKNRIVIGKDTRLSGYMIENALSSGICSMGGEAIFLGPLPTPGTAFITQAMRAAAGVMISASHNPYYDNGIKFFDNDGYKLPDDVELEIESLLAYDGLKKGRTHAEVGKAYRVDDAAGRYIEYLKTTFPKSLTLEGFKIVVDCGHGAAYKVAPTVFEELGATVVAIGIQPDGLNINENSGALHPESLQRKVREEGAQLGIALDGDADRLVLVDERGAILHGDVLLALGARDLQERGALSRSTVVATVMSNLGLELTLRRWKIHLHRVQVGDRYVIEAMRRNLYNFGGEQSGHLIFSNYSTTGDGILAALQLISFLKRSQVSLSQLADCMDIFPQVLLNVRVQERRDLQEVPEMRSLQADIQKSLGDKGRLLLRYSGTEPLLRIMIEGEDQKEIERYAQDIKIEAEKILGRG